MSEQETQASVSNQEPLETSAPAKNTPAAPAVVERVIVRRSGGAGTIVSAVLLSAVVTGAAVMTQSAWTPYVAMAFHTVDPQARIVAIETGLAQVTADSKTVKAEMPRLAEKAASAHTVALMLVADRLAVATDGNKPFITDYEMLAALAEGDEEITGAAKALAPLAATGVPTVSELRSRFFGVGSAMIAAAAAREARTRNASAGASWLTPISTLVTQIRYATKLDTPPADGEYAIVSRVEERLARRDLNGAVETLAAIGEPSDAVKAWIASANSRIAIDKAVADLVGITQTRVASK